MARHPVFWSELHLRRARNQTEAHLGMLKDHVQLSARQLAPLMASFAAFQKCLQQVVAYANQPDVQAAERAHGMSAWPGLPFTTSFSSTQAIIKEYNRTANAFQQQIKELQVKVRDIIDDDQQQEEQYENRRYHVDLLGGNDDNDDDDDDDPWKDAWNWNLDEASRKYQQAPSQSHDHLADKQALFLKSNKAQNAATAKGTQDDQDEEEFHRLAQPLHDELTSNLLSAVGDLKRGMIRVNQQLKDDAKVVDQTDQAVDDANNALFKQRKGLTAYTKSSTWGIIRIITVTVVVLLAWALMFVFIRLT